MYMFIVGLTLQSVYNHLNESCRADKINGAFSFIFNNYKMELSTVFDLGGCWESKDFRV